MTSDDLAERARTLVADALIWDAHSGFAARPDQDLMQMAHWSDAGVDFISVNIGFDLFPWEETIRNVAAFRHWFAARPERYILVDTIGDVLRAKREGKLAVAFDIEGAVSLGGQLSMLAVYHRLGVRQIHFVYNVNNEAGGGCHDDDTGLTDFGRDLVDETNRLGMLLDLSHVGHRTTMEIMERSAAPVIFSHSNPKWLVDHPRNITEEQMRACAATGGLVALNGSGRFLGDPQARPETLAHALDAVVQRIGVEHVGLGLDYTFAHEAFPPAPKIWPPQYYAGSFDCLAPRKLPDVAEWLMRHGYAEADIRQILGKNFLRVAGRVWTSATPYT